MNETYVLAAIDDTAAAAPVLRVAAGLAGTLGIGVVALHVRQEVLRTAEDAAADAGIPLELLDGDPVAGIARATARPEIDLLVIGARGHTAGQRPGGHVALALIGRVRKPVVVVPPDVRWSGIGPIRRVLLPLEGSAASTESTAAAVRRLAGAGVTVVAVHVFQPGATPRFWDQSHHTLPSWTHEFLAQWSAVPAAELRVCTGDVPEAVLAAAADTDVDLIALGWSQVLAPERAHVVREILGRATVPVLLAPVPD